MLLQPISTAPADGLRLALDACFCSAAPPLHGAMSAALRLGLSVWSMADWDCPPRYVRTYTRICCRFPCWKCTVRMSTWLTCCVSRLPGLCWPPWWQSRKKTRKFADADGDGDADADADATLGSVQIRMLYVSAVLVLLTFTSTKAHISLSGYLPT